VLKPEEVAQAKAEAREQFEKVIACAAVKPHEDDLDRWYQ
jgi:hypothetical protein